MIPFNPGAITARANHDGQPILRKRGTSSKEAFRHMNIRLQTMNRLGSPPSPLSKNKGNNIADNIPNAKAKPRRRTTYPILSSFLGMIPNIHYLVRFYILKSYDKAKIAKLKPWQNRETKPVIFPVSKRYDMTRF